MRRNERAATTDRANHLLDVLEALDFDDVDDYSREVAEEVRDHERRREAELLAAAKDISERNRGGK